MSEILRLAARGDGVTADGRHVPLAAPGDRVAGDGKVLPGPHHADPPCRHFGTCGGCELQHCDDAALAQFVTDRVVNAAKGQGVVSRRVLPPHLSPPKSRRRATLHAASAGGRVVLGFREHKSHRIIDMRECHILMPVLFDLMEPLRQLLSRRTERVAADIALTLTDQGADCGINGLSVEGLEQTQGLIDFARHHGLARLTIDHGYGPEPQWEPQPVTVTLGGVPVPFPSGGFLQATRDGEAALVGAAREWLADARTVADLFAGLGTFAFALAGGRKILAAEAARDAHLACSAAARSRGLPVHALHRDLFRNPLQAEELSKFDAVVLDPPRAGAREQVARLAESSAERIVYISCNPASWARDAAVLVAGGYDLAELKPVGQFRWSTHVELASLFVRR